MTDRHGNELLCIWCGFSESFHRGSGQRQAHLQLCPVPVDGVNNCYELPRLAVTADEWAYQAAFARA